MDLVGHRIHRMVFASEVVGLTYPSTICSDPTNRAKVARERGMTVRATASVPDDPIPHA